MPSAAENAVTGADDAVGTHLARKLPAFITRTITKPYFSFDASGRFASLGTVRRRGIESSLVGRFGPRFSLLAGAVVMDPVVSGPGRTAGLVGPRPAGTPLVFVRIDANYRTDIFGGLTPTVSLVYTGSHAASSKLISPTAADQ